MPCRSDYMQQTNSERRFQQTARLLVLFHNHLSLHTPQKFYHEAQNTYAANVGQVEQLCKAIRDNRKAFEVYLQANLRSSAEVRELADWWDEHQEEDAKREAEEKQDALDKARFRELTRNLSSNDKRILKERLW